MEKNNFEELEQKNLSGANELPDDIHNQILSTRNMMSYLGDVIGLYLPKFFDMIVMLFSADDQSKKKSGE